MLPIVVSILLATPLALCQAPFWMPNMQQFSFLTETDFRNALLLPTTNTRRVRSLYHDMRIPFQV